VRRANEREVEALNEGLGHERSSWAAGYTVFAACVMITVGILHAITGLVALLDDQFFVIGQKYVFKIDVTTWGWIHLVAGLVVLLAGLALFSGAIWARTIGVLLAVVSAIANFAFLPYYPVWSIVMIALDVAILWALTVHGRDVAR
jgi:hypothetical protein